MHQNVQKVLFDNNIAYREIRHDSFDIAITSPMNFAQAVGYELSRITKSVFLKSKSGEKYVMAVCSIDKKLNFLQLAYLSNTNKLEVASKQELAGIIGYESYGVGAIGIPAKVQVIMDKSLLDYPSILIGSGEAAVEIEINPNDLLRCSNAVLAVITQ